MIFVFGSNEAGRHGKGAALYAKKYFGAIPGVGFGIQGNSFAIPTKDKNLKPLPLDDIRVYVDEFITFAEEQFEKSFNVTRVGCGLAGYTDKEMAPLFRQVPENVNLPEEWRAIIAM